VLDAINRYNKPKDIIVMVNIIVKRNALKIALKKLKQIFQI